MLSNYISDKYTGGFDYDYNGGVDNCWPSIVSILVGLVLGYIFLVLFLYFSRQMTGCSSSFISHLDARKFSEDGIQSSNNMKQLVTQRVATGLRY